MSLTIPNSLNVKQNNTIAIKADDWNQLASNLDSISSWRKNLSNQYWIGDTFSRSGSYTVGEGEQQTTVYWSEEHTITGVNVGNDYENEKNNLLIKENSNNLITAETFNKMINKVNILANSNLSKVIKDETLITAKLIQSLIEKIQSISLIATINTIYTRTVNGWPAEGGSKTFTITYPETSI